MPLVNPRSTASARSRRASSLALVLLTCGFALNACASTITWNEEVVLHDGKTLIVKRSHTYDPKGPREIGQPAPLIEATLAFTVPGTDKEISWKSDHGRGYQDNLSLLLLDFQNDVPHIATTPTRCHAYNKWDRPNPPYVFFKYTDEWRRIPLDEFPTMFREANVLLRSVSNEHVKKEVLEAVDRVGFLPDTKIKALNRDSQKGHRTIAREPIKTPTTACEELIYYKGGWISPKGTFGREFMDRISK